MPLTQRLAQPANTPVTEPVDLALLRAWVRVDGEQDDVILRQLLTAAREKVENYTVLHLAGRQRLALTFDLSETYALPEGATFVSVSGFFTNLETLTAWSLEEYRKGISVNRELHWSEAISQQYTVVVDMPAAPYCPQVATSAILELAAEWYRNRDTSSSAGVVPRELPVSWRVKLAELRPNPLL
jgi:hypothetical protein